MSALMYAMNKNRYKFISGKTPDFNVLQAIRKIMQNEEFTFRHVKGHQDKENRVLDFYANLNIQADYFAKQACNHLMDWQMVTNMGLHYEQWHLRIENHKVVKNIESTLHEFISKQEIKQYWDRKGRVSANYFEQVSWSAIEKAMKFSNIQTKHWITKRAAGDCGANAILFRRQQRQDDKCPFCGEQETVLHVYQCNQEFVQQKWDVLMKKFKTELKEVRTSPIIIDQLCLGLHTWRRNERQPDLELVQKQEKIGWNGILEGMLGVHWQECQEEYYIKISSKKHAMTWAQLVIRKLWNIAWELWQHRNQKEHADDKTKAVEQLMTVANREFELGTQNFVTLQKFLGSKEIAKITPGNHQYVRAWIRIVQATRQRENNKEEFDGDIQRMRNCLYRFLGK
jgi:hypothetical protein